MAFVRFCSSLLPSTFLAASLAIGGCSGEATGESEAGAAGGPSGGSSGAGGSRPVGGTTGLGHAGAESDGFGGVGGSTGGANVGGANVGGANVGGANVGGANVGGGSAGTAGSSSVCPATAPELNAPCSQQGSDCSFGDSPFPECRPHLVCVNGKWAKGFGSSSCSPTPESSCPATVPSSGADCSAMMGARCAFASGALCSCVSEACGGTGCTALPFPQWTCGQAMPSCPKLAPNAGTACDTPMSCNYEYCGLTATCQGGYWKWLFGCA